MQVGVDISFTDSIKVTEYDVVCARVYRMNLRWLERWLFADTVTAGEASYDENRTEPLYGERNWIAGPKPDWIALLL